MTGKIHYTGSGGDVDRTTQLALLFLDEDGGSRSVHFDAPNPDGAENVSLVDLARTDRGLVIGSTDKRRIDDTDGDGEDDYDFDAWLLGLTRAGEQRWYLSPGDTSNTDRTYVMAGSGRSVVLGGRWHEGHDTSGDDPLDSFVTRVSEPDEETPTETSTPTRTDTETGTGADDETQTDTEPGTETRTDEADCEI